MLFLTCRQFRVYLKPLSREEIIARLRQGGDRHLGSMEYDALTPEAKDELRRAIWSSDDLQGHRLWHDMLAVERKLPETERFILIAERVNLSEDVGDVMKNPSFTA